MAQKDYGHFSIDENGYPRAQLDQQTDPKGVIGMFLQTDVGGLAKNCDDFVNNLNALLTGLPYEKEATGNLFTVTFSADMVRIENVYDEAEWAEVPPKNLIVILTRWKNLVHSPKLKRR